MRCKNITLCNFHVIHRGLFGKLKIDAPNADDLGEPFSTGRFGSTI